MYVDLVQRNLLLAYTLCIFIILGYHGITSAFRVENMTEAMEFLETFGYVDKEDIEKGMDSSEMTPMLLAFQKMSGIDQTGVVDNETLNAMNVPRCGNKDLDIIVDNVTIHSATARMKRYELHKNKLRWKTNQLTYRMGVFSREMKSHVTEEDVLRTIHKAFRLWSEVTNLDFFFRPNDVNVDIELSFTKRFHIQDSFSFDGPGKTLAHAFPPGKGIGGDVHFEDEEDWQINSPKGIDVLFVAVHEIGHALGLSHSSTKGAIMAAYYGGYRPHLKLHPDDVEGIQALYGQRESLSLPEKAPTQKVQPTTPTTTATTTRRATTTTKRTTTSKTTTPKTTTKRPPLVHKTTPKVRIWQKQEKDSKFTRPDLCSDAKIDAITTLNDGYVYAFKGSYVFKLGADGGILPFWPNHLAYVFRGLETNIDAAMTRENGKTYFFKGAKYWRFTGRIMDKGYPKAIVNHFKGIPSNVDAAFVWHGQFYFIKGDKFWRFDAKRRPHVDRKYPMSTSVWNIQGNVDAALNSPAGDIFFFMGQLVAELDPNKFTIKEDPQYMLSALRWFGCKNLSKNRVIETKPMDFYEYVPFYP